MDNFGARFPVALAAAALGSFPAASTVFADTPGGRAVIRGTGSNISIVYEAPKPPAMEVRASLAEDPVDEALRRKSAGEDDAAIIAFLRLHQASLPEVIDSEVLREFRKAGAGPSVISVLNSFAAVDIGETAEGSPAQELPPPQAAYTGAYPDLVGMGYPFYGGGYFGGGSYIGDFGKHRGGGKRFGRHGSRHGFDSGKRFSPPRGHFPGGRPGSQGHRRASRARVTR